MFLVPHKVKCFFKKGVYIFIGAHRENAVKMFTFYGVAAELLLLHHGRSIEQVAGRIGVEGRNGQGAAGW